MVAVRKTRLQALAEAGSGAARAVLALKQHPERFLASVQIGITLVSVAAAAYGGASIALKVEPLIARVPSLAPYASDVALAGVIVGVAYLSIVVGELVPKSLALRNAERYALAVGRVLLTLSYLARPVVWLLTASSNLVLRPFGDRTNFTETRHSAEELQQLVGEAMTAGSVNKGAGEIASRALELPELTAQDVMVPRREVVCLRRHSSGDELRRVLLEHTYSRMPVLETPERVVGYVSIKDLLALAWERELLVLDDVMRPPPFVPATKKAIDLLRQMQATATPFAIVVDEHGLMLGIVTLEDLLEEVVGEIFNERVGASQALVEQQAQSEATVAGATPIRELNRSLALQLPDEGGYHTVAGLCLFTLGRIPQAGESLCFDGGVRITVVDASPRRIRSVRLTIETSAASRPPTSVP